MRYSEGKPGRTFVAKFDHGEDLLLCLTELMRKEDVRAGIVWLVGALAEGRVVTGPEELVIPPSPKWMGFDDGREMLGVGTIFWQEDEPKIHLHASFGRGRDVITGCLREVSETFLIVEAVILEVLGTGARREFDETSQLSLLNLETGH